MNFYKYSKEFPYHISVGAVLFNSKNEVACQVYSSDVVEKIIGFPKTMRTLMRETLEEGETILDALHRGLREEFGVTGTVLGYVGALQGKVTKVGFEGEAFLKTTLYFLVRLNEGETLVTEGKDDWVTFTSEWKTPDDLIAIMNEQSKGLDREDLNEAVVLERAKSYLL